MRVVPVVACAGVGASICLRRLMATGKKCLVLPAPWSPNCCKIAISLIDPVSDPRPATSQLHPDLYPAPPPQRSAAPSSSVKSAQHSSSSPAQLNTSQLSELSLFLQGRSKLSQFP